MRLERSRERAGERSSQRRRDHSLVNSVGWMRVERLRSLGVAGILHKGQHWYAVGCLLCRANSRSCGRHGARPLSAARQAPRECRPLTFVQTSGARRCVLSPFSLLRLLLYHCQSSTAPTCVYGAWWSCLCCRLRLPGVAAVVLPPSPTCSIQLRVGHTRHCRLLARVALAGWAASESVVSLLIRPWIHAAD